MELTITDFAQNFKAPTSEAEVEPNAEELEAKRQADEEALALAEAEKNKTNEPQEEEDVPFTTLLAKEFLPEDLETTFTPDFDGVKSLLTTVAETHAKQGRDAFVEQLIGNFPEMDGYLQYRMNGGKPEEYFKVLAENTESSFEDDNEAQHKDIVRNALAKTLSPKMVEATLVTLEETGSLKETAKEFFDKEQGSKAIKLTELTAERDKVAKAQKEADDKYWDDTQKLITGGKIKDLVIPTTDRKAFFEWQALPKENGLSQEALDWQKLTDEERQAIKYFIFKKGDVKALANRSAETSKVTDQAKAIKAPSRMEGNKEAKTNTPTINLPSIKGAVFN